MSPWGGTNAKIFQIQCRVLKQQLSNHFRLVFAQGPFPTTRPGPDVTAVFSNYGPFRQWIRETDRSLDDDDGAYADETSYLIQEALRQAIAKDDMQGATGDVVGVLGFSQGGRMAASLLYNRQVCARSLRMLHPMWLSLRFAVVLAGRGKLVWLTPGVPRPTGTVAPVVREILVAPVDDAPGWEGLSMADQLYMPSLHVHGLNDDGLQLHRKLMRRYCRPGTEYLVEWEGAHRVPIKSKDVSAVKKQILRLGAQTGVLHIVRG